MASGRCADQGLMQNIRGLNPLYCLGGKLDPCIWFWSSCHRPWLQSGFWALDMGIWNRGLARGSWPSSGLLWEEKAEPQASPWIRMAWCCCRSQQQWQAEEGMLPMTAEQALDVVVMAWLCSGKFDYCVALITRCADTPPGSVQSWL